VSGSWPTRPSCYDHVNAGFKAWLAGWLAAAAAAMVAAVGV